MLLALNLWDFDVSVRRWGPKELKSGYDSAAHRKVFHSVPTIQVI